MCGEGSVLSERIIRILVIVFLTLNFAFPCSAEDSFLVLCYHDIPKRATVPEDVPQHIFVKQLEYLKTHGYNVISLDDIQAARKGLKSLPKKSVLLTFDDAYLSFYDFVYPMLKLYNHPVVLSIVTSWIDKKPVYVGKKELMSWEQIEEVVNSGLVYCASHTHDLHKRVVCNPSGNIETATSTFIYLMEEERYEKDDNFRVRVSSDLRKSIEVLEEKTGVRPRIITWPYGEFNEVCVEEAKKLGFEMMLTLIPEYSDVNRLDKMNRNMITNEMELEGFASKMKEKFKYLFKLRIAQVDLDMIINSDSYDESDYNLGLLIERLVALGVNTVFIQGFCDRDGSGNIGSLYFYNAALPVEMDFLSHAVNRIRMRGMRVYVWMPVLSYELKDKTLNDNLKVRELKNDTIGITTSWYRRLSPFDERSLAIVRSIYRDLSAYVKFDGILFQDDAYLTDEEDFHPSALNEFKEKYGKDLSAHNLEDDDVRHQWIHMKTEKIDRFIQELQNIVKRYRPIAKFARNIYSEAVLNPSSQEWFSQDFEEYLNNYDYTAIMAYPQMEGVNGMRRTRKWFGRLIDRVNEYNAGKKVIFKIQSYDWSKNIWIEEDILIKELRFLLSSGVKHVGYYPDNVYENRPSVEEIVPIISAREYPREWKDGPVLESN